MIEFPEFKDYVDQKVKSIQRKLDGHLTKIHVDGSTIKAYSKNDKDITEKLLKVTHIREELMGLPSNSQIFGELHCPGVLASSIPTLLNNADERLMFTAFAAPVVRGINWSHLSLESVMIELNSFGLDVSMPQAIPRNFVDEAGRKFLLETAIKNKWEGWVLKNSHMKGWYKLKPVKTIDGFVTNTYKSTSNSFPGGLKCIQVGVWDGSKIHNLGTAGNGFKKPFRMQFMSQEQIDTARATYIVTHPNIIDEELAQFDLPRLEMDSLLNKVCEIAYDSITAGKKLRFPRFIRWRDDKDIKDCTVKQMEN